MRSDREIQEAVLRELHADPRVEQTDVGVEVDEGVVTLTGSVNSYARRVAAQQAAHHVAGVLDVANDIRVRVPGMLARDDTELCLAARKALEWHVDIPHQQIYTTVSDGVITLEGQVEHSYQRAEAEKAVGNLTGVREVINHLEAVEPKTDPRAIESSIVEALERRADRQARRIDVTVRDGSVVLSGPVHSWLERRAVLGAVRHLPGVRTLTDNLYLEPET